MDNHKNPNLQTSTAHRQHHHHHVPPSYSSDFNINNTTNRNLANKNACFSLVAGGGGVDTKRGTTTPSPPPPLAEESGRERLKKHRVEMAGRVWIPDIWGQEDLLKDWIDCTVFDSTLENSSIASARTALVQEARSTVRIENRC